MRVGVPREIKVQEFRVGLVPSAVRELVLQGHEVLVETGAGEGIGASDADYAAAGAVIAADAAQVFAAAELIVKVKEPQAAERRLLRDGQILFTYLHLAPDPEQTRELIASGATCIAYETVTSPAGGLPLLAPMSEVAGRLSIMAGAQSLLRHQGGCGVLLGGVPGVTPAQVVILGGGVVGMHAASMAQGLGARVVVIDRSLDVLRRLWAQFGHAVQTVYATRDAIEQHCMQADLVIGGVLVPGAAAPKLVTRDLVRRMRPGSVIVDVAIDQGGCCETSHATTHDDPVFVVDGVVHYCVANMPGAVPRTSAHALGHATLPFVLALAAKGRQALREDPHLLRGLNVHRGQITHPGVAQALDLPLMDPLAALSA
ncbi:MAG TPA: alanine dehydrogenase [Aquabacterium sp.]|uniref:alanine dehydrogenase n=1 Tax=Aquabacterium sp. TaxID=1872578 RepID=UPI002E35E2AF|nr:alanine dehydrogenase [Aquabacterium sp.]HEX5373808.1 alanine dehydrogenase [Aquabacterium sp.]